MTMRWASITSHGVQQEARQKVRVYLAKTMIGVCFGIFTSIAPSFLLCVSELESSKVSSDAHLVVIKHQNLAPRWSAIRDTLFGFESDEDLDQDMLGGLLCLEVRPSGRVDVDLIADWTWKRIGTGSVRMRPVPALRRRVR